MTLLNAVLLAFPSPYIHGSENQVVIQDNLNERLKVVPAVPKLHRMNVLLKEHEWEEKHDDDEDESFRAAKRRKRLTLEDFQVELPASEQEIAQALNDRRILTKVTPQPPSGPSRNDLFLTYLYKILELLLMHLVSLSQLHVVMRRFGQVDDADERWKMDDERWCVKSAQVFCIRKLSTDAAMRFADLFLTHDRWKAEHIKPYLSDIVVDAKDPDKLLLKYCQSPDG
ncbi:hypothetical protein BGY98DRAFT_1187846 [Russula aff. rugulosa BPL654]|nr:hypothetical protein BGY98DRAFT_1187846 [Russula aff. rugulosa BPL654]